MNATKTPIKTQVRARSEINVTPLIDIVLVLLIVFIVLVPGLSKALAVNVPKSGVPPTGNPPPPLVVTLDPHGKILLQREEILLSQLADRLVSVVQLQPLNQRKVFLKVDGEALQQQTVDVLDQIRVASERAKAETARRFGREDLDGGDVKVAVSLKSRT